MNTAATFLVYQASAGSGKTYTLVKEYLKLCLKSEGDVSNFRTILAMTFTNAAANEMKERIVSDLCNIIGSSEPEGIEADLVKELGISDAQLKKNAQSLLTCIMHDYSSFCVCTIDSFVQKISRSFVHELGLSSQYTVSIDGKEMANAVVESMGAQISDDNAFLSQIVSDFCKNQFDNDRSNNLQEKLISFIEKLMAEKAYQRDENNNIHNLEQYKETDDFLKRKLEDFEGKMKDCLDQFKAFERRNDLSIQDYSYVSSGFASYFNKIAKKNFEEPGARFINAADNGAWYSKGAEKRFSAAELDRMTNELTPILQSVINLIENERPSYLFYKSQRNSLCMYALRTRIREEFQRISDEDEIIHISEFNKMINNVLGDYSVPFIYEKVGETYRHVFVDEFQDTSVMQWQNLLPLIDNGLSTNEMSMVVGDGKQSIYRFRSGEVGQLVSLPEVFALPDDERYEAFAQYQENLKSHFGFSQLDTNRRSFQNIIKFNNDFFEKVHANLAIEHQRVYIDKNTEYGKEVSIAQKTFKEDEGFVQVQLYDPNDTEFCFCAIENLIVDLLGKGYQYGDIAILTRKANLGSEIANYLNDKNIPVVSRDSILIKSSNKVRFIVNTLRYLIDRNNEVVVANEIYLWHLVNGTGNSDDVTQIFDLVKAIAKGEADLETGLGLGQPGLLNDILSKATCLYDLCASLERLFGFNSINDAFLDFFMEEVFKWQSGVTESITDFLTFWDDNQNILSVASVSANAVNIMTIHKSKGLQFPVVIYPKAITDLDLRLARNSKPEEIWVKPEDLGFDPIPNLEKVLFKLTKGAENMGARAKDFCQKETQDNRLDNLNLLYVAFTRAMQRLYVFAEAGGGQNVIQEYLDLESLPDGVRVDADHKLLQFGDPSFNKVLKKEKIVVKPANIGNAVNDLASCDWFGKINVDTNPSMLWMSPDDKMSPSEWGELVHEMLSKVETASDIDHALQPYVQEGVIDVEIANLLKERILQMVNDSTIGRAFAEEAKVKNECEILSDGQIKRPDRFVELPDEIILLDYKTGKKDPDHHRQLKDYIVALRQMVPKDIRAYLVYLTDPIEVEEVVMDTLF